MARIRNNIEFVLEVAAKLAKANIPFDLGHQEGVGILTCRFDDTLDAAVKQALQERAKRR